MIFKIYEILELSVNTQVVKYSIFISKHFTNNKRVLKLFYVPNFPFIVPFPFSNECDSFTNYISIMYFKEGNIYLYIYHL